MAEAGGAKQPATIRAAANERIGDVINSRNVVNHPHGTEARRYTLAGSDVPWQEMIEQYLGR